MYTALYHDSKHSAHSAHSPDAHSHTRPPPRKAKGKNPHQALQTPPTPNRGRGSLNLQRVAAVYNKTMDTEGVQQWKGGTHKVGPKM